MLKTESLSVRFGRVVLVDNVTLSARAGEVSVLMGANGAGKSTLFHALAGSVIPTSGSAWMCDREVQTWPAHEAARVRAVLSQNPSLGFDFGVRAAVALGRIPHDTSDAVNTDIAEQALAAVGLGSLSTRSYLSLSGGEKQRVHIARTLAQVWDQSPERRCIMLDEPTVNLDFTQKRAVLETLRTIARQGASVLVVLHELNLAAQFGDRLFLLKHGRMLASGRPDEVLTEEHLRNAYGGSARVIRDPETGVPIVL